MARCPRGRGSWSATKGTFAIAAATAVAKTIVAGSLGPGVLVGLAVQTAVLAAEFRKREGRAEDVGRNLGEHLTQIPDVHDRKINLIGHSLGARILHYGLAESNLADLRLGDVVMLGAAADAHDDDWAECAAMLEGKIHNVYFPRDGFLRIAPVARRYAGVRPIPGRTPGIRNHEWAGSQGITSAVLSHLSYWQCLPNILKSAWPGFRQAGRPYFEWTLECPETGESLTIAPDDGSYTCPWCHGDVEVDGLEVTHA